MLHESFVMCIFSCLLDFDVFLDWIIEVQSAAFVGPGVQRVCIWHIFFVYNHKVETNCWSWFWVCINPIRNENSWVDCFLDRNVGDPPSPYLHPLCSLMKRLRIFQAFRSQGKHFSNNRSFKLMFPVLEAGHIYFLW